MAAVDASGPSGVRSRSGSCCRRPTSSRARRRCAARYRQLPHRGKWRATRTSISSLAASSRKLSARRRQPRGAGSHAQARARGDSRYPSPPQARAGRSLLGRLVRWAPASPAIAAIQPRAVPSRDERGLRPPAAMGDRWHGSPDGAADRDLRGRTAGCASRATIAAMRAGGIRLAEHAVPTGVNTGQNSGARLLSPLRVAQRISTRRHTRGALSDALHVRQRGEGGNRPESEGGIHPDGRRRSHDCRRGGFSNIGAR